MTPLQLDPSAHAPWMRTMEGFGPDPVSDLTATTYAGTMRRARIANGMNFFISIIHLRWLGFIGALFGLISLQVIEGMVLQKVQSEMNSWNSRVDKAPEKLRELFSREAIELARGLL